MSTEHKHTSNPEGELQLELFNLGPTYEETPHSIYKNALVKATEDRKNKNIAVLGPYSAGKSSVIEGFIKEHNGRCLRINIFSDAPHPEQSSHQITDHSKVNHIQRAILNHLILASKPASIRKTRIKTAFNTPDKELIFWLSLLFSLLTFYKLVPLQDLLLKIDFTTIQSKVLLFTFLFIIAILASTIILGRIIYLIADSFQPSNISLPFASLNDSKHSTIFEDHFDDIATIIKKEEIDTIIFEDLERFNTWQIFEELRNLNSIVNTYFNEHLSLVDKILIASKIKTTNSSDNKSKNKNIVRFIYVANDLVFKDHALKEDDTASPHTRFSTGIKNATLTSKFFDIIIPVIQPKVSNQAINTISELLVENDVVESSLINYISNTITDFRVLKNISNQYKVLAERLSDQFKDDTRSEKKNTAILGLVVYKILFPEDFYKIAIAESDIDEIYRSLDIATAEFYEFLDITINDLTQTYSSTIPSLNQYLEEIKNVSTRITYIDLTSYLQQKSPLKLGDILNSFFSTIMVIRQFQGSKLLDSENDNTPFYLLTTQFSSEPRPDKTILSYLVQDLAEISFTFFHEGDKKIPKEISLSAPKDSSKFDYDTAITCLNEIKNAAISLSEYFETIKNSLSTEGYSTLRKAITSVHDRINNNQFGDINSSEISSQTSKWLYKESYLDLINLSQNFQGSIASIFVENGWILESYYYIFDRQPDITEQVELNRYLSRYIYRKNNGFAYLLTEKSIEKLLLLFKEQRTVLPALFNRYVIDYLYSNSLKKADLTQTRSESQSERKIDLDFLVKQSLNTSMAPREKGYLIAKYIQSKCENQTTHDLNQHAESFAHLRDRLSVNDFIEIYRNLKSPSTKTILVNFSSITPEDVQLYDSDIANEMTQYT
ncbi:hypothetical protein BK816_01610 [Boudabousia tangfeifanii]|uniref:YobI-like P-loop NTPase domain-containing protein n=1 Tax=Boudabousia tangfeifanii TaxID=1912795 RepID=A0A1D9MIY5_9ACTO|nr:hypothetical protein [Boudabousia tangfeifanii]AOZ72153.1 hypothetical protein BK816_01610 [Boudabousia tangfeifanii]